MLARAGLAEILPDRGHQVVAAVGNAEDLLAAIDEYEPDVTRGGLAGNATYSR